MPPPGVAESPPSACAPSRAVFRHGLRATAFILARRPKSAPLTSVPRPVIPVNRSRLGERVRSLGSLVLFCIDLSADECFGVVFTNLKANGAALERGTVAFL